jgi:hypothetical protein
MAGITRRIYPRPGAAAGTDRVRRCRRTVGAGLVESRKDTSARVRRGCWRLVEPGLVEPGEGDGFVRTRHALLIEQRNFSAGRSRHVGISRRATANELRRAPRSRLVCRGPNREIHPGRAVVRAGKEQTVRPGALVRGPQAQQAALDHGTHKADPVGEPGETQSAVGGPRFRAGAGGGAIVVARIEIKARATVSSGADQLHARRLVGIHAVDAVAHGAQLPGHPVVVGIHRLRPVSTRTCYLVVAGHHQAAGLLASFQLNPVERTRRIPAPGAEFHGGRNLSADGPGDSVVGADGVENAVVVSAEQEMDVPRHLVHHRGGVADGDRGRPALFLNQAHRAPRLTVIGRAPQDDVNVAAVAGRGLPALAESQERPIRCADDGGNAISGISPLSSHKQRRLKIGGRLSLSQERRGCA